MAKQVFIQQGFTIESTDIKSGIIKAVRNMQDKNNSEFSCNINASADISEVGRCPINHLLGCKPTDYSSSLYYYRVASLCILPIILAEPNIKP
jgi:hypothetical protein